MDLEGLIVNSVNAISEANFSIIIYVVMLLFAIFWSIVLGWVWFDSGERTTNRIARVGSVAITLLFNVLGLVIYLIVRPKQTIQELYWADLERRYLKFETNELGDCPECGFSLQPGFNVCPKCGYRIKIECKKCNVWVDKTFTFCPYCSENISKVSINTNKEEVSSEIMEGELNKSREEAIEVVEGNKTKFVDRHGLLTKIKESLGKLGKKSKKKVKKVAKKKTTKKKK